MVALQPTPSLQPIRIQLPHLMPGSELEQALSEAGERRRIKRLEQRRELADREARSLMQLVDDERPAVSND